MRYFIGVALVVSAVLIPMLVASPPARADEPQSFPEEECQRYGVCESDNLLDPASPNYDPDLAESLKKLRNDGLNIPPPVTPE